MNTFIIFLLLIMAFAGQIAVEIFKGYVQLKFAKKRVEVSIDAAFAKIGNIGLQSFLQRIKGGGNGEM